MDVFSYSRCSTCRKALAWLADQDIAYQLHDIISDPPSRLQLSEAVRFFGDRKPLFNTSGQSYRSIGSATIKAMNDEEALDALAADGKLIKRPFLQLPDGTFLVGFKPEVWEKTLLN